ncbi:MAG: D-2-hydroxyacid dehydrogenase [Bacteroidota bacterium]
MKIVHLDTFTSTMDGIDLTPLDEFENFVSYGNTVPEKVIKRAKDADILLVNKVVIDEMVLNQLPNLKYICVSATGYNNVDVVAARKRGIPVSNVSGYSTDSVVQHVFSMIFHVLINVAYYDEEVMDGRWQSSGQFTFYDHSIRELKDKTMGIYGYGTIGKKVAQVARAFGMNVIAAKRKASTDDTVTFVNFDTLLTKSDFLSLHSSLNESNKEIMNAQAFNQMKPSSILINTARGGLINEFDLANALNMDKIAFACLDVLSQEPPEQSNPLLEAKNCIITPHIAWTSLEARKKLLYDTARNIRAFITNAPLLNVVN